MKIFQTNKIFTPTTPAISSFVERNGKINNHLVDSLQTPGKQIVIYGHSGCGKTTLVINKLNQVYENVVITRCMKGMTFENIILDGFDQLDEYYNENNTSKSFTISPKISFNYNEIKSSISLIEYNKTSTSSHKKLLPPQLTPQRLGSFFGASNTCWVLEDFHKIIGADKTRAAQLMKVFMDMSVDYEDLKIIAIGAVASAREVVEYDSEMNNRVTEIQVPYMKHLEIKEIITNGEEYLNLKFSPALTNKIIQYSCGLPSICHQLCLNMCFNKSIYKTPKNTYYFNETDLDEAIEKFVEEKSDTLKASFDKAIKIDNRTKFNLPKELISSCLSLKKDEFSFDEIISKSSKLKENVSKIEVLIKELCGIKRGEILVYDENSNKYRFNNLFLKNYALLQLRDEKDDNLLDKRKDRKIIERLLDIIEKDIQDGFEFILEDR